MKPVATTHETYVDRRDSGQILGVPGEAKILRALAAKSNATRRMGTNGRRDRARRTHGRKAGW